MNLHNQHEINAFDKYLKRKLKSMVSNKQPPADAKRRLLEAARGSASTPPEMSFIFSMAYRENNYDRISIERVRMATAFSLRIDAIGLY